MSIPPPEPPTPPECRLQCNTCGFIDKESTFHENHKCHTPLLMYMIIIASVLMAFALLCL